MSISLKRVQLLLAAIAVAAVVFLGFVNFTDACRLETVTLNRDTIEDWQHRFDMLEQKSIFRQQLDSLANVLLADKDVFKVDLSYSWPHVLDIKTNAFAPVCFLLDKKSGKLYGLDGDARVVPLDNATIDWEHPVLTGVKAGGLFEYCEDVRVHVIVDQLERLRKSHLDFYRLVDQIDLEATSFVQISITGLPYRLKVRPQQLWDDLKRFVDFVTKFNPDLDGVCRVDLRFDDMIICARGKN